MNPLLFAVAVAAAEGLTHEGASAVDSIYRCSDEQYAKIANASITM